MSSSMLTTIQTQLTIYGYPFCLILGNVGSLCIVLFFSQERRNARSIYLISSAIANDIYLTFNGFLQIFPFYFRDETIRAIILCKFHIYVSNITGQIANSMLILTCIDQFLITSDHARYRAMSTKKRAKLCIFLAILFWIVFCCHIPIMTTIINGQCTRSGIYATVYIIYTIIFVSLWPTIILSIFGFSAYRHLRQSRRRVLQAVHRTNQGQMRTRRYDRELLILILCEVFVYIIATAPYPIMLVESFLSQLIIPNKSVMHLQMESFLFTIIFIILLLNNASPFYIYLLVSKTFRRDFQKLIMNTFHKLFTTTK